MSKRGTWHGRRSWLACAALVMLYLALPSDATAQSIAG